MGGDPAANFVHWAIQRLHWSPSQIQEWLDAEQETQAFYYASTELKVKGDNEEAAKIRKNRRTSRRKR